MRIETWDTGFVRARRRDVHALLALPLDRYGQWWPGVRARGAGADRVELAFRPPGLLRRSHRVTVEIVKRRPNLGVSYRFTGRALTGEAEFFYTDEPNGVVVNYLLRVETRGGARRARRLTRDHRAVAREALHALKDRCEGGRLPGTDPDPRLLADQRDAIAEFQAGVEAHARKVAAAQAGQAAEQGGGVAAP
ncbi:MAG TPA: hypothetical protein VNU01_01545 [Egibacteraceae bacterium]|nr:hypothetical protein [Egibacteraceae bacterium]